MHLISTLLNNRAWSTYKLHNYNCKHILLTVHMLQVLLTVQI